VSPATGVNTASSNFELAGWMSTLAAVANIAGLIVVMLFDGAENAVSVVSVACLALAFWPADRLLAPLGAPGYPTFLYIFGNIAWVGLAIVKPTRSVGYGGLLAVGGPLIGGLWLGGLFARHARALPRGARLFAGLLFLTSICVFPLQLAYLRIGFDADKFAESGNPAVVATVLIAAAVTLIAQTWMFFVLGRIYFRVKPKHLAHGASDAEPSN
jgi:hypothetical protein